MAVVTGNNAASWETLRKEARKLENEIDSKLVAYSKLAVALSSSNGPQQMPASFNLNANNQGGQKQQNQSTVDNPGLIQRRHGSDGNGSAAAGAEVMGMELEHLIERLAEVIEAMGDSAAASAIPSTIAAGGADSNGATSMPTSSHMYQRHSEILNDYRNEFRRTKKLMVMVKEKNDLVVPAFKRPASAAGVANADALYAERAALIGASSGVDTSIEKGVSLRDELERQRQNFASMMGRMEEASSKVPTLNRIIGQIKRKKKRDIIIFAGVIVVLTLVTVIWKVF